MSITVTTTGNTTSVNAPYNPEFAPLAKAAGGRWNPTAKVWNFDVRDDARVREILISIHGTDGSTPAQTVTLRVNLDECGDGEGGKLYVAGRLVASRRGRDEAVRLGAGVVLVSGSFARSGGSTKYPTLESNHVILEVRDVPLAIAQKEVDDYDGIEIVGEVVIDRAALIAAAHAAMSALTPDERNAVIAMLSTENAD